VVILNSEGLERFRIEGFLPPREFHAQLKLALARIVAMRKRWADAEPLYASIVEQFADTAAAPEALYWRGVAAYQGRRDHTALVAMAAEMKQRYPIGEWAIKAAVWS
jgi:TolA-binding protein